jgi:hypothetical protein
MDHDNEKRKQRCYYNIDFRKEKGKNTRYNSANFFSISPYFAYLIENQFSKNRVRKYACTLNWGMRRSQSDATVKIEAIPKGPAYKEHDGWQATTDLNVSVGFILLSHAN